MIRVETTGKKEYVKYCVRSWRNEEKTIGFVPTLGALHQGHISLVRQARAECDIVVVSIFVNPLQFNTQTDLDKYPRDLLADQEMLQNENVDLIFAPSVSNFYESEPSLKIDFGYLETVLEGAMRPGHFSGVGIVVARLFHAVEPNKAYFGAKDLQQVAVIKKLVRDLAFDVQVISCPTLREKSGLAMSSRNSRLSEDGKILASELNKALKIGIENAGSHSLVESKNQALAYLSSFAGIKLEYLEWVDADSMVPVFDKNDSNLPALCLAAWVEEVRLIDNMTLDI